MQSVSAEKPAGAPPLLHGILVVLALAPIIATGGLYLFDVPNHLFRVHVVAEIVGGRPSSFYELDLKPIPNMPLDLAAVLLGKFVDPVRITLWIVCAAVAGFYISILYWRTSNGRSTSLWIGLLAILVLYSFPLQAGLINYVLGIAGMYFALARLERFEAAPPAKAAWAFYPVQWLLVLVTYFCSLFPVMLYFVWCAGAYLYDWLAGKVPLTALIKRGLILHLPALAAIAVLIVFSDPSPPGDSETVWVLAKKLEGLVSIGRMSNLPHEFLMFAAILAAIGLRFAAGTMRLDPRHAAGLVALVVCFLALPAKLQGVTLIDARMPMAIAGVLLAVARETPAARRPRLQTAAAALLVLLFAGRGVSLAASWLPLSGLNAAYAELARRVEPGSAVYFVLDGLTNAERERRIVAGWANAWRTGHPPTRDTLTAYATFWHLHMPAFRGRDVYLSQTFQNFSLKQRPGLPLTLLYRVPLPLDQTVAVLANEPYDYVLSHIDLTGVSIPGKRLCLVDERAAVRLYRLATDTCPSAIASR